jgi:hypothetical protein
MGEVGYKIRGRRVWLLVQEYTSTGMNTYRITGTVLED